MKKEEVKEKIRQRRRQILLHSFGYYRMNETIVSDETFDRWCRELVEWQRGYPEEAGDVEYKEVFAGFDGSTGYHLPTDLPWLYDTWVRVKKVHREKKK